MALWRFSETCANVEVMIPIAIADRRINIVVDGPGTGWRARGKSVLVYGHRRVNGRCLCRTDGHRTLGK